MGLFDYIRGDDFRECLESDFIELEIAENNGAYKAALVIAGSIVEAILVDYLVDIGYAKKNPLEMTLGEAIDACRKENALSRKTAAIADAIREYRNLVHPGRQIRLGEKVDENSAVVAKALVQMVANDTSVKRQERHGYTAEQVLAKIEKDPSAISIIAHLLKEENETERLLLKTLPKRFMEITYSDAFVDDDEFWSITATLNAVKETFRSAFDLAGDNTKLKVAMEYVRIIMEESGDYVKEYEDAFVYGDDISCLEGENQQIAKQHILSRFANKPNNVNLALLDGLAPLLKKKEISNYIDPLVKTIISDKSDERRKRAKEIIKGQVAWTSKKQDIWIMNRLDNWIIFLEEKNETSEIDSIREIRTYIEVYPFYE
ncbi:MAG: DUF4145 domain-containing protein [Armatimonadota bacterium]